MASLNQNFAQGLLAAALRKGLVKPEALVGPGMYDPNLDFQGQNQALGFFQQFGIDPTDPSAYNPGSAYNVNTARINEGLQGGSGTYRDPQTGQELSYTTQGSLANLLNNRNQAEADYHTRTQDLSRNYQNLASSQAGNARAAGVAEGGALAQALAKRTANQQHDQGALDESWRRYVQGYDQSRNSLISQAAQGQQNLDTGLGNAQAQNTLFKDQLGGAKIASAQNLGTLPELPAPSYSPGYQVNQRFGNAIAAAYNDPNRKRTPVKKFF